MAALSPYLAEALARLVFKNNSGSFSSPGDSLWVALFTSGGEVSGGSYARQQVVAADWTEVDGEVENAEPVPFPQATAPWGELTHVQVMDDDTTGNMLMLAVLVDSEGEPTPRLVDEDDVYTLLPGELRFVFKTAE